MKTECPNLYKECKNCVFAADAIESESKNPTLIDIGEKFTSTKIEIKCEVQDDGPQHRVYMTRWHEGHFSNNVEQDRRREGESGEVRCPHFEHEWV